MRIAGTTLVVAVLTVQASWAGEQAPKLDFAIEDQFGTLHTDEDCGKNVILLLGGGRKGSTFIDDWGPPLHDALATELDAGTVCSVGFAHLKGVPFFVKKKIVASFPKDPDAWTLLDWKGQISRTWGAEKDAANLYLFNRDGRLVLREALHGFDGEQLDRIVNATQSTVGGN